MGGDAAAPSPPSTLDTLWLLVLYLDAVSVQVKDPEL